MKVIIIGNGISGITAARQLRKGSPDIEIVVISDETPYFFARTALMYVYMEHMRDQDLFPYETTFWAKNRIQLVQATVNRVLPREKTLFLSDGQSLVYDYLILAVGSRVKRLAVPGADLEGIRGFYSWQDLKAWQKETQHAQSVAIVGGGLIGVELAEMMISAHKKVYLILRESSYWNRILPPEESQLISNHLENQGVHLLRQTEVISFTGQQGRVDGVRLTNGTTLPIDWVGMSIGVEPRVGEMEISGLEIDQGILTNEFLETSLPNVYAIGDCVQRRNPPSGRSSIEAMWYTGRTMGEYVAQRILGATQPLDLGVYFNSAKFFDLEYQIYGVVPSHKHPEIQTFAWVHQHRVFRVAYRGQNKEVVGVSGIGIRLRQEVWTDWMKNQVPLEETLQEWEKGSFDPEFTPAWGKRIRQVYSEQTGYVFKSKNIWNWLKR